MVASQKRRVENPSLLRPIAIGAVIVVIFMGGLKWGGHTQGVRSRETANELHHREDALRSQMDECHIQQEKNIEKSTQMDSFADDMKARNRKLELRNKELYTEHSTQEETTAKCQEELDSVVALVTEADRKRKNQIKGLQEEVEQLGVALNDITHGEGMRTVLLTQSLKRARSHYLRALNAYNTLQPKEEAVKSPEEITEAWKDVVRKGEDDALNAMKDVESDVDKWVHWRYDREKHPMVFLNVTDEDGDIVQPEYFGRRGTQPVVQRRRRDQPRRSSVASKIVELQDFGLCAMENNNPNFTFPDKFFWHDVHEETLSELHRLISTPLVTFCNGCRNHRFAKEFREACMGDTAASNYGNYSYWNMRSRIRFLPSVHSKVRDFMIGNNINEKKVLAAVVPTSELTLKECQRAAARGPLVHFKYIRGNFDEQTLASITNDTESRCAPTWSSIVQRLLQELNDHDGTPFEAVYLSVEPNSVDTIHLDDISNRVPVVILEQKSAFEEAMDIELLSQASRVIVSPFLQHSRVVTEQFLLNHGLLPEQNVRFW